MQFCVIFCFLASLLSLSQFLVRGYCNLQQEIMQCFILFSQDLPCTNLKDLPFFHLAWFKVTNYILKEIVRDDKAKKHI